MLGNLVFSLETLDADCSFVVTMFGFGVVSIEIWHTDFPVWGLLLAFVSPFPCPFTKTLTSLIVLADFIPLYSSYRHNPSHHEPADWSEVGYFWD